jgi:hypothetical protein
MNNILIILKKDIKESINNGMLLFLVIGTILFSLYINYGVPQARNKKPLPVAVISVAPSPMNKILGNKNILFTSEKEANSLMEKGMIAAIIAYPLDILERIEIGEMPEVKIIVDASRPLQMPNMLEMLKGIEVNMKKIIPVRFNIVNFRNIKKNWLITGHWIIFTIMIISIYLIPFNIMEEKIEQKTLSALLLTSLSETQYIVSKWIWSLFLCVSTTMIILVISNTLVLSSSVSFWLALILSTICLVSIGLFVPLVCTSTTSTVLLSTVVICILSLPSFLIGQEHILSKYFMLLPGYNIYTVMRQSLYCDINIKNIIYNIIIIAVWAVVMAVIDIRILRISKK